MNTAAGFLPEINSNKSNQERSNCYSRMKQVKESLRARLAPAHPAETLSSKDIALFRNSPKQSICVQLLQEGFHRSFSELFSLLSSDQGTAEPGSVRLQAPLVEQTQKMETISLHLSRAEEAERTGVWSTVCEQRLLLGRYFSAPEDLWLRFYFYHSCADREKGGISRAATEARACLAELYLGQGDLEKAKQQGERCLQQAEDGGWLDSDGGSLKLRACRDLWRIYRELAEAPLAARDYEKTLTLLHKGYSRATESEDKALEGEAAFQVGLAYQGAEEHGSAQKFFNTSMEIFKSLNDTDRLVKAYNAFATSLKSEGNVNEAVECLEKLAAVSRSSGLQHRLVDIFLCLGNIHHSKSQYTRAAEYYQQGYEVACSTEDVAQLQRAQVLVASARAYATIGKYSADLKSSSPAALHRLLAWRVRRGREDLNADSEEYYSPASFNDMMKK
ncbi:tetratricopeptide repeat protein 29 [Archocentrus centrarchus]|uniref:tetratricopeptide repeat protein 29 n=1 Tax=Archocentrus centrarchus TaxID=63155 RepID=UPI0011E9F4EE|nr:tetratricopeptide repeat protein 29 [Archocentrus centrarchus]XP_030609690.1 tetratricopeptide repeat protein 29 [Archocentrus centrarchus]XP_030609691.1 tetratricopeptide repeat protein 29 [Archocentrus centrarchus]